MPPKRKLGPKESALSKTIHIISGKITYFSYAHRVTWASCLGGTGQRSACHSSLVGGNLED